MRKIVSFVLTVVTVMFLVLLCGIREPARLMASSDDPGAGRADRAVVSGFIETMGLGFVVVSGGRFDMESNVKVIDKEGKEISGGTKALKLPVDADLILENDQVVQIKLVIRPR